MDINDLRSAVTLTGLLLFVALVSWVWSARRREAFEAAAQLPFLDEAGAAGATSHGAQCDARRGAR